MRSGKFQGTIAAQTPIGSRRTTFVPGKNGFLPGMRSSHGNSCAAYRAIVRMKRAPWNTSVAVRERRPPESLDSTKPSCAICACIRSARSNTMFDRSAGDVALHGRERAPRGVHGRVDVRAARGRDGREGLAVRGVHGREALAARGVDELAVDEEEVVVHGGPNSTSGSRRSSSHGAPLDA